MTNTERIAELTATVASLRAALEEMTKRFGALPDASNGVRVASPEGTPTSELEDWELIVAARTALGSEVK